MITHVHVFDRFSWAAVSACYQTRCRSATRVHKRVFSLASWQDRARRRHEHCLSFAGPVPPRSDRLIGRGERSRGRWSSTSNREDGWMKTACRLLAFTVLLCLTLSAPAAAATYGGSATGAQV